MFYRQAPNFGGETTPYALTREALYAGVAEHCVEQQKQQGSFHLSDLAACIENVYPNGHGLSAKYTLLDKLRRAAVFLDHDLAEGSEHEVGVALAGGGLSLEYFDVIFANPETEPVKLCLAALLGSVEKSKPPVPKLAKLKIAEGQKLSTAFKAVQDQNLG